MRISTIIGDRYIKILSSARKKPTNENVQKRSKIFYLPTNYQRNFLFDNRRAEKNEQQNRECVGSQNWSLLNRIKIRRIKAEYAKRRKRKQDFKELKRGVE